MTGRFRIFLSAAAGALLAMHMAGAAMAQPCDIPPWSEIYESGGAVSIEQGDDGCSIAASLTMSLPTSAAVTHFRRRDVSAPLRASFRVDLSELNDLNALQLARLFSGVSQTAVPVDSAMDADVFTVIVFGNLAGTVRHLGFTAACTGAPGGRCSASVSLTTDRPTIGLELDIGKGDGALRWWIDRPFSEPPTGEFTEIDNATWIGVDRLSLGLASPTAAFAQTQVNSAVIFDRIEFGDDLLAWRNHEIEGDPACPVGPPISPIFSTSGTTCGGSQFLPTLASGSTGPRTPARNYTLTLEPPLSIHLTETEPFGAAVFLCDLQCGPAARCHFASVPGTPMAVPPGFPAGDYAVIVKAVGGPSSACGEYTLTLSGPLDSP